MPADAREGGGGWLRAVALVLGLGVARAAALVLGLWLRAVALVLGLVLGLRTTRGPPPPTVQPPPGGL